MSSRTTCTIYSKIVHANAKVLEIVSKVKDVIKKINKTKASLKMGMFKDLGSALLAGALSSVTSIAKGIVQQLASNAADAVAKLLEAVFAELLKIFLSAPTIIYSLVSIPHKRAIEKAHAESANLAIAQSHLKIILSIISKWAKGPSGLEYYKKMKLTLPYLERVSSALETVITELTNDEENAVFNESAYSTAVNNLRGAIEVQTPKFAILNSIKIDEKVERRTLEIYNKKAIDIRTQLNIDKKRALEKYTTDLLEIAPDGKLLPITAYGYAVKREAIVVTYNEKISYLKSKSKSDLAIARTHANTQALLDKDVYKDVFDGIADEFSNDMKLLVDALDKFYSSIKDAYANYIQYHQMCITMYNFRSLIGKMINFLIKLLRKAGNATGAAVVKPIEGAKLMVDAVDYKYQKIVSAYEVDQSSVTSIEMAGAISLGDMGLIAADTLLAATITESMIGLINADDELAAADQRYEKFVQDLYDIEDWDDKKGVWSVTLIGGATSPYIKLLSKSTKLIATTATVGMARSDAVQNSMMKDSYEISNLFKSLRSHNRKALSVLVLYTPYQPSELIDLTRMLGAAGLLNSFALGLNLASIVSMIIPEIQDVPTLKSCVDEHEDLFPLDDEWIAKSVAEMGYIPDLSVNSSAFDAAESSSSDVEATMLKLERLDINKDLEQPDMMNGDVYIDSYKDE